MTRYAHNHNLGLRLTKIIILIIKAKYISNYFYFIDGGIVKNYYTVIVILFNVGVYVNLRLMIFVVHRWINKWFG